MLLDGAPDDGLPGSAKLTSWVLLNMAIKLRIVSLSPEFAEILHKVLNPCSARSTWHSILRDVGAAAEPASVELNYA